jgi:hypothetical protein
MLRLGALYQGATVPPVAKAGRIEVLYQGTTLVVPKRTEVLYQGTTLVVPNEIEKRRGFSPCYS